MWCLNAGGGGGQGEARGDLSTIREKGLFPRVKGGNWAGGFLGSKADASVTLRQIELTPSAPGAEPSAEFTIRCSGNSRCALEPTGEPQT